MQVERVADADVQGGQHPRLAVDGEAEGAVVRLVEDRVRGGPVVATCGRASRSRGGAGGLRVGSRSWQPSLRRMF